MEDGDGDGVGSGEPRLCEIFLRGDNFLVRQDFRRCDYRILFYFPIFPHKAQNFLRNRRAPHRRK
jgi:hypothetical protein